PGVVHRLSQDLQFLVLRPSSDLQANVIDRRSDHKAKRLEPGLAEQHVLRDRQVGGENARRIGAGSVGQPAVRGLWLTGARIASRLASENWHVTLLRPDSPGTPRSHAEPTGGVRAPQATICTLPWLWSKTTPGIAAVHGGAGGPLRASCPARSMAVS